LDQLLSTYIYKDPSTCQNSLIFFSRNCFGLLTLFRLEAQGSSFELFQPTTLVAYVIKFTTSYRAMDASVELRHVDPLSSVRRRTFIIQRPVLLTIEIDPCVEL